MSVGGRAIAAETHANSTAAAAQVGMKMMRRRLCEHNVSIL
jgi:hypothetical protein